MTAIDRYTRLEAVGVWRETPEHAPREVVVSFGNATLLLSDFNETPLAHWAMAATQRASFNGKNAIYTPDTEAFETLAISDIEMIDAIAQVSRITTQPRASKALGGLVFFVLVLVLMWGGVKYIPPFVHRQAIAITTEDLARKFGIEMLAALDITACAFGGANTARDTLIARSFPARDIRLIIVRDQNAPFVLPGGLLVVNVTQIQAMQTPEQLVVLLTEMVNSNTNRTLTTQLLSGSNFSDLLTYITTGNMSEKRLYEAARQAQSNTFSTALPTYILQNPPLLRDQDWVALQNICLN